MPRVRSASPLPHAPPPDVCDMKVFLAHNYYQQPGGEGRSFADEAQLLEERGHEVVRYTLHNDRIDDMPAWKVARATLWNPESHREVRALLRREQPDVAHFNNTFPLMSPSVYYAAHAEGVATVQTLHNFRLLCLNACLFRDGGTCEDCLGPWGPVPGLVHGCYRSSRVQSLGVAALQAAHRMAGTWRRAVDRYIALTPFARQKFVDAGLPADRVALKPHFLPDPPPPGRGDGGYAVFVGRLSPEKGIRVLLDAWRRVGDRLPLVVIGDGPLGNEVRSDAETGPVEALGWREPDEVQRCIARALMLVAPSLCYETFGRVAMEALAAGTPVIAPRHGALRDVVDEGCTGRLFQPGSAADLARQVAWALDHPDAWRAMRTGARRAFEARYTAGRNYEVLMRIYRQARARRCSRSAGAADAASTDTSDPPRTPS